MEMTVHDEQKIVEIWLTNAEKENPQTRQSLKEVYNYYRDSKYLVAVFESGEGNLYDQTLALLKYNRKKSAETELQMEKSRSGPEIVS